MVNDDMLKLWILEAVECQSDLPGYVEIAKYIWLNYEEQLRVSGNKFYTWQADLRWLCTRLVKEDKLVRLKDGNRSVYSVYHSVGP